MKTRAKSAFIMAPLLVIIFLGGYCLVVGVIALTILALHEFSAAFGDKKPSIWALCASACLLYVCYFLQLLHTFAYLPLWLFVSLVLSFLSMFDMKKTDLGQGMATILGMIYIIFLSFHLVLVDNAFTEPFDIAGGLGFDGVFYISGLHTYVWIIVLSAFGADIFAYFTGKLLGSRPLCPSISPKKTIEGSVGGVLGSLLLCGLFGYFFLSDGFVDCLIIGVLGGVVSQLGDLSASVMKRRIGIKDWGTLIPGHGGVLDRVDSILFTAPLVYYFLMIKESLAVL